MEWLKTGYTGRNLVSPVTVRLSFLGLWAGHSGRSLFRHTLTANSKLQSSHYLFHQLSMVMLLYSSSL
jgi:hypothetical protein